MSKNNWVFQVTYFLIWTILPAIIYVVIFIPVFGWKLLRQLLTKDFYSSYPCSLLMLIAVLCLSLSDTESPQTHETLSLDKLLCGLFYMVMTSVFWIEYLRKNKMQVNEWSWVCTPCVVGPIMLSGMIELLQHYVFLLRSGEWLDWMVNSIAICISALFWCVYIGHQHYKIDKRFPNSNKEC